MKTDVIEFTALESGIKEALAQTEKAAAYRGLSRKETLRLQLLAEEMMGMLRTIVGEAPASYWVEAEGKAFALHLTMKTKMNMELREELLKTSTSGKNEAAKGFMGRIRDVIMQMCEPVDANTVMLGYGYCDFGADGFGSAAGRMYSGIVGGWSLNEYRMALEDRKEDETEKWDELEKSITANLADEVKIFINGNVVEMVVEKAF
ncbi:MAG: hypothetical protein K5707_10180 [Clostridia bacterium]|nr:hypothetical protein [Clostridia bacterium]